MKIDDKEWERLLRNKKIVYKSNLQSDTKMLY